MRAQQDYWEWSFPQILLEWQIPVHRHEHVAFASEAIQQITIIKVRCPEQPADSCNVMAGKKAGEASGHACVEHDADGRFLRGARFRLPNERLPRKLEDRDCMLARHVGKVGEKVGELMPAFDVID
jgi:hypothetical protein